MNPLAKLYQKPLDLIDGLLDSLSSYRLALYSLLVILGWAVISSFNDSVPFTWHAIIISAVLLVVVCRAFGELFSKVLNIARNQESDYITALILALIMSPAADTKGYAALAGAGFAAIASKYLLTLNRRHIFNPAAAGAFVSGAIFSHYASWWVGTTALMPLVMVTGILIAHKMKRFFMVGFFLLVYLVILVTSRDGGAGHIAWLGLSETGVLFFAFVMLTEPLTSPDAWTRYLPYAILVGILYSAMGLGLSPEESLLIGNAAAYLLVRDKRLELKLLKTIKEADGIYSYVFNYHGAMDFKAGQFMEWTLPLAKTDSRGNRRYMTVSSSPTEGSLMFTVRMPANASHFKQALASFKADDKMLASHLGGSFLLPKDSGQKLAFVAGGIGVTPFRSMVKYLLDKKQVRDISLLYSAHKASEFAFTDLFSQAKLVGLKASYFDSQLTEEKITETLPDYKERLFYISGPYGFVKVVRKSLLDLGVSPKKIKSDYFPGYG